jgi:hypothetical protein
MLDCSLAVQYESILAILYVTYCPAQVSEFLHNLCDLAHNTPLVTRYPLTWLVCVLLFMTARLILIVIRF